MTTNLRYSKHRMSEVTAPSPSTGGLVIACRVLCQRNAVALQQVASISSQLESSVLRFIV